MTKTRSGSALTMARMRFSLRGQIGGALDDALFELRRMLRDLGLQPDLLGDVALDAEVADDAAARRRTGRCSRLRCRSACRRDGVRGS